MRAVGTTRQKDLHDIALAMLRLERSKEVDQKWTDFNQYTIPRTSSDGLQRNIPPVRGGRSTRRKDYRVAGFPADSHVVHALLLYRRALYH